MLHNEDSVTGTLLKLNIKPIIIIIITNKAHAVTHVRGKC